jgi:hypothetical protein
MIKTFLTGAIPVGLFVYLCVFHTTVFLVLFIGFGLALASYMIGEAIREEFFEDKNG